MELLKIIGVLVAMCVVLSLVLYFMDIIKGSVFQTTFIVLLIILVIWSIVWVAVFQSDYQKKECQEILQKEFGDKITNNSVCDNASFRALILNGEDRKKLLELLDVETK